MIRCCTALLLTAAIGLLSHDAFARTWIITPDGSGDAPTIQAGIDSAVAADTVLLANGTFTGNGNRDIEFGGKAIIVRSQSGNPDSCIIDCEASYEVRHRGFNFRSGEDSTSVIESVTITQGYAPVEPPETSAYGGCIYCESSSPKIVGCKFTISRSTGSGGAVACIEGAAPIIRGCEFIDNLAASAGAVHCQGSSPTIERSIFSNNIGGYTGAVGCVYESDATIIDCVFTGNVADGDGALTAFHSSPTVVGCRFENNHAVADGAGAVYASASSLQMTDCRFINNDASTYPGGAVWITDVWAIEDSATSVFTNCTFEANSAEWGGGFYGDAYYGRAAAVLTNCTFIGNTGNDNGGGISFAPDFAAEITNCTFVSNSAPRGGAVYYAQGTTLSLDNSIVAYSANGGAIDGDSLGTIAISCTDIYGNSGGDWIGRIADQYGVAGNISLNPLFCDLDSHDLTLASLSPCLPPNNTCGVQMGAYGEGCDTPVGIDDTSRAGLAASLWNYPNPFNPTTRIVFTVPERAPVLLAVYDVSGRLISTLVDERRAAGTYYEQWDGSDRNGCRVASGVYFLRLTAGGYTAARKAVIIE